jgi:hypothetical protein
MGLSQIEAMGELEENERIEQADRDDGRQFAYPDRRWRSVLSGQSDRY